MARIIRLTPEIINQCRDEFNESLEKARQDFETALADNRVADGKFDFHVDTFSKNFSAVDRKATVYFTEMAWLKMTSLLREFGTEVGWHGLAHRDEDEEKDIYYITDILVYPQTVAGATVDMDETEYANWIRDGLMSGDERFLSFQMHGHSHVNMGVTPSGTDIDHQKKILEQIGEDGFYIFMIYNKSLSKNVKIYDIKKNILFETEDVNVEVLDGQYGIDKFIADAKERCKTRVYTPAFTQMYRGAVQSPMFTTSTPRPAQVTQPKAKKSFDEFKVEKSKSSSGAGYDSYDDDNLESRYERIARDPFGYLEDYWR